MEYIKNLVANDIWLLKIGQVKKGSPAMQMSLDLERFGFG
jgi:hypothetical protein